MTRVPLFCSQIKRSGNDNFNDHDFSMAVTRYVQVGHVLKDIRAVRPEETAMINDLVLTATRNLSLAALKNWEWSKARRACDKVRVALVAWIGACWIECVLSF